MKKCAFLCCLALSSSAQAAVINYQNFNNLSGFQLNGSSASINAGGTGVIGPNGGDSSDNRVLRLTNNTGQSSSVFLSSPISLAANASFSTYFEFQFTNPINGGADGLVFAVQTNSATAGGGGGGIGYAGITKSIGVEFDNWNNGGGDGNSDNHVGIDINGNVNSAVLSNSLPAQLDGGSIFHAWVDYDGVNKQLQVRTALSDVRPGAAMLSYGVDLPSILQQTDAYIGFTSGTGGAGANHDVRRWIFDSTYNPIVNTNINSVPEPTPVALLASGLLGIGFVRRKSIQA